uniref:Uncharacterized protein n=1 Tax=Anguilla anguilla TaxID=7936 RepID=A0A0E9S9T2_ANGAN
MAVLKHLNNLIWRHTLNSTKNNTSKLTEALACGGVHNFQRTFYMALFSKHKMR